VLEKQHGRREDLEELPSDNPQRVAFRNDDKLVKTLLLLLAAALVPEVESLRALNAERLAALNHGTIKTPIPGREGQEVLRRCRTWAASVGEIRIGEETTNPTISVQLSGVDTETIIEQARREDNQGNRIRRVRQLGLKMVESPSTNRFVRCCGTSPTHCNWERWAMTPRTSCSASIGRTISPRRPPRPEALSPWVNFVHGLMSQNRAACFNSATTGDPADTEAG
jgi:hypothetical protein